MRRLRLASALERAADVLGAVVGALYSATHHLRITASVRAAERRGLALVDIDITSPQE